MSLDKIEIYGLEKEGMENRSKEELLAHIKYLETNNDVLAGALDYIVHSCEVSAATEVANRALMETGVRNWKRPQGE